MSLRRSQRRKSKRARRRVRFYLARAARMDANGRERGFERVREQVVPHASRRRCDTT